MSLVFTMNVGHAHIANKEHMSLNRNPPIGHLEVLCGPMYCHAKGQKILMSNGSTINIENVQIGDSVMSPNGPVNVTHVHHGFGNMMTVTPSHVGSPFTVTEDHELTLVDTPSKKNGKPSEVGGRVTDVSVKEWLLWSRHKKGIYKLFRVPVRDFAVENRHLNTLDPYFLGVLLGDGTITDRVGITSMDREMFEVAEEQAKIHGMTCSYDSAETRCPNVRIVLKAGTENPILKKLDNMGLRGCVAGTKFIPSSYKTASWDDRLNILAGLIDTDGNLKSGKHFEYSTKSEQLANDVSFVAASVGLTATVKPTTKKSQNGTIGNYFRVHIGGDTGVIPTRLPRKKTSHVAVYRSSVTSFSVADAGVGEYFGITVEGGRYLMGDFMVTHNSGKTEELIRRLRRAVIAKQKIAVFKPHVDTRSAGLESHSKHGFPAMCVHADSPMSIIDMAGDARVIGIEEAQFFTGNLFDTVEKLINDDRRVIVAGLDMDAWGKPFGQMPQLMAIAERIDKLTAICTVCGEDATRSHKTSTGGGKVDIGATDKYEARCRVHFSSPVNG